MSSEKKYELSQEKKDALEKELRNLLDVKRKEIIEQLKTAREQGDLSENADYDAARNEQAVIESRIKEIQEILDHASIISRDVKKSSNFDSSTVRSGSSVVLLDDSDKKEHTYRITSAIEADPENNIISVNAPLARAIMGKSVGMTVEVRGIEKPYRVTVKKIDN